MANDNFDSDDELVSSHVSPNSPEAASMPSSGAATPSHDIPRHDLPIERKRKKKKKVDWDIPEDKEQELREGLYRILSNHSRGGSPGRDGARSPPVKEPKPVLRKGDITPTNEDVDEGVANFEGKKRSAVDAHRRASRIARDLFDSRSRRKSREDLSPQRNHLFRARRELDSGQVTPEEHYEDYVQRPSRWRLGGLSAVRMAAHFMERHPHSSAEETPLSSGYNTPRPRSPHSSGRVTPRSTGGSMVDLIGASTTLGSVGMHEGARIAKTKRHDVLSVYDEEDLSSRPKGSRASSSTLIDTISKLGHSLRPADESEILIKDHVQETVERHRYLLKLCRALMQFGAPTHRLEEYMKMSARTLHVKSQYLYIPGCMIVSFDDPQTFTTEVKLVRTAQGLDLGKLRDTHDVYKNVVHDSIGVIEASARLEKIFDRKDKYSRWVRVIMYGVASLSVGPFAFGARFIDLPMAFLLGCVVGILQLYVAPQSDLYANVFEITAVIVTSFAARGLGSAQGGNLFCFSALAQSSIALILPGYTVLCGALELQARSLVAGSVRLVYAIIYSLFLGFALTIGTALYGLFDSGATSDIVCKGSTHQYWVFVFVPIFTVCLMVINQAKYKQMPIMLLISFVGYVVNYFSARRFVGNAQISSTFGAFAIAIMANGYSRIGRRLDGPMAAANQWIREKILPHKTSKTAFTCRTPSALEKQSSVEETESTFRRVLNRLRNIGDWRITNDGGKDSSGGEASQAEAQAPKTAYSLAASAMLPAIFVQVPSGLSVSGSLVSGLQAANQITGNGTGTSTVSQADVITGANYGHSIVFTVASSVLQIAIGITVGLFLGTLVIYPTGKSGKLGKSRSGLFTL